MPLYNADGEINLTEVDGENYVGRYAADGSINIVINDGSTYTGRNHPSGAMNAVVVEDTSSASNPNGSQNVILQADEEGYTPVG